MPKHFYTLLIIILILTSCKTSMDDKKIQELFELQDSESLKTIQENAQEEGKNTWQSFHNLGYITYLLWELWEWWIEWLTQILDYFYQSYEIWGDSRTKNNIEILEELLNELLQAKNEEADTNENWGEEADVWNDENQNQSENTEDIPEENWDGSQNWEDDDIQPQSEQIFREFWYTSQQELLQELERYTDEILERQERNIHELRRNDNESGNPIEEFFYRWNPFFSDIPEQWEKDW